MPILQRNHLQLCDLRQNHFAKLSTHLKSFAVVQFVHENRRELIRPELLGLPPKRMSETADLVSSVLPLADALVEGQFESSRQVLFSHFLKGCC